MTTRPDGTGLAVLATFFLWACDSTTPADDAGRDGASPEDAESIVGEAADDSSADAARDVVEVDGGGAQGPGPLTFVASELTVLTDRVCDFDADGSLDNAIADMGGTTAGIFAATMTQALQGFITEDGDRYLFHFTHVEDRAGPDDEDTVLVSLWGYDADGNLEDDFSGDESFLVRDECLDRCREPLYVFDRARLADGELTAEDGVLAVLTVAPGRGAQVVGTVGPGGSSISGRVCAYFSVHDLGPGAGFPGGGDLSTLEVFLAGGEAFGIPGVAGLTPDVDLDGDGLERIELDDGLHVARCIDGDGTVIEGGDCWMDERMVDALSVTLRFDGAPAGILGVQNEWRAESCLAEGSLWGACSMPELRACEPGASRPCEVDLCGEGVERCRWDCSGWGSCISRDVLSFQSCDDVRLQGGASCSGTPGEAVLVDGPDQSGGFRSSEDVTVGRGRISIQGRITASRGATELPGNGWALSAALDPGDDWVGTRWYQLGLRYSERAYSLRWIYHTGRPESGDEPDVVDLIQLRGNGYFLWGPRLVGPEPSLDSSSSTPVAQGLRLDITPDLPETPENELVVEGFVLTDEGPELVGAVCTGAACLHQIVPGQVLGVGVTASSFDSDIRVSATPGAPPPFEVEVFGACQ